MCVFACVPVCVCVFACVPVCVCLPVSTKVWFERRSVSCLQDQCVRMFVCAGVSVCAGVFVCAYVRCTGRFWDT